MGQSAGKPKRYIVFRVYCVLMALLFIAGFGAWQLVLAPWLVLPDSGGHGWPRIAERHQFTDGAAGILMGTTALCFLLLAWRPLRRIAVATVGVSAVCLIFLGSGASMLIQQNATLVEAILSALVAGAVTAGVFVLLYPERVLLLNVLKSAGAGPTPVQRLLLLLAASAGVALAVAALALRASASYFDHPREDNVVTLVMLGLVVCISGLVAAVGLQGWPWVAGLLGAAAVYIGAAAIFAGTGSGAYPLLGGVGVLLGLGVAWACRPGRPPRTAVVP